MKINAAIRLKAATDPECYEDIFDQLHELENAEVTLAVISKLTPKVTKALVLSGHLCPSRLYYCGPYPGFLAEILVKSAAEESLTDITNTFYDKTRKLSPEALKIFQQKVLSSHRLPLDGGYENYPPSGFDALAKAQPEFVKKFLLGLPKGVFATMMDSDAWVKIIKPLKLNA